MRLTTSNVFVPQFQLRDSVKQYFLCPKSQMSRHIEHENFSNYTKLLWPPRGLVWNSTHNRIKKKNPKLKHNVGPMNMNCEREFKDLFIFRFSSSSWTTKLCCKQTQNNIIIKGSIIIAELNVWDCLVRSFLFPCVALVNRKCAFDSSQKFRFFLCASLECSEGFNKLFLWFTRARSSSQGWLKCVTSCQAYNTTTC